MNSLLEISYSNSIVLGGLSLTERATWVTSGTSAVIRAEIVFVISHGSSGTLAVIASHDSTIRKITMYPKSLISPLTPVTFVSVKTAKYCHSVASSPSFLTSYSTIALAFLQISISSGVNFPITRTASPGPGNGCLLTISSGRPNLLPITLTSSL